MPYGSWSSVAAVAVLPTLAAANAAAIAKARCMPTPSLPSSRKRMPLTRSAMRFAPFALSSTWLESWPVGLKTVFAYSDRASIRHAGAPAMHRVCLDRSLPPAQCDGLRGSEAQAIRDRGILKHFRRCHERLSRSLGMLAQPRGDVHRIAE